MQINNAKNIKLWKTIENWGAKGVGDAHRKGYKWLKSYFTPALIRAEAIANSKRKKKLLAGAYYVLGDIHDFNDAPLAAINSYKKSVELYPSSGAWREMGNMYVSIGDRDRGIDCIEKALAVDSKDEYAITDLNHLREDSIDYRLFFEGDIYWQVNELLVDSRYEDALKLLKNGKSLKAMLHKARIYGAKEDRVNYLNKWIQIARGSKKFELKYADWFYIPNIIWDSADFWKCMIDIFHRLKPGVAVSDDSLLVNYQRVYLPFKGLI